MREPLRYTVEQTGESNYFRLYECEHITDGTYPREVYLDGDMQIRVIPVGSHSNLAVCKHCWIHIKGMVTDEIVNRAVRKLDVNEIRQMLEAPLEKA